MSFRFSLYRVSKETVEKFKNITEEEWIDSIDPDSGNSFIEKELKKECIKFDSLKDILLKNYPNNLSSRLFVNNLDIENDMTFLTINKEQFLNIIKKVRENIINYFNNRIVDKKDKEYILGSEWKNNFPKWSPDKCMHANQGEWNHKARRWMYNNRNLYMTINLNTDDKWSVSGDGLYEYLIFDLIHILKIFDWNNSIIVAIGG